MAAGGAQQDLALLLAGRVADPDVEHEAVALGLGQRVGALLLDRILGREDEERLGQLVGGSASGDGVLLHRLQQCRLGLRRGAVDLVGEQHLCEHRPTLEHQFASAGRIVLDDLGAGDVAGHQVGSELDTVEAEFHGVGQGANHRRLGQTGHPFEQAVAARQDGDDDLLDHLLLTDDDGAYFARDAGRRLAQSGGSGDIIAGNGIECHVRLHPGWLSGCAL